MSGTLHVICSHSVSVVMCLCVGVWVCMFAREQKKNEKNEKVRKKLWKKQPNLLYAIFKWAFDVEQLNIVSLLSVIGFFFILTWFTSILLTEFHSLRSVSWVHKKATTLAWILRLILFSFTPISHSYSLAWSYLLVCPIHIALLSVRR